MRSYSSKFVQVKSKLRGGPVHQKIAKRGCVDTIIIGGHFMVGPDDESSAQTSQVTTLNSQIDTYQEQSLIKFVWVHRKVSIRFTIWFNCGQSLWPQWNVSSRWMVKFSFQLLLCKWDTYYGTGAIGSFQRLLLIIFRRDLETLKILQKKSMECKKCRCVFF